MIVDDSNVIRNKIQRACAGYFEVVATAKNGEEAVQFYNQFHPDVITMDLTMPKMDGLKCINEDEIEQAIMEFRCRLSAVQVGPFCVSCYVIG